MINCLNLFKFSIYTEISGTEIDVTISQILIIPVFVKLIFLFYRSE